MAPHTIATPMGAVSVGDNGGVHGASLAEPLLGGGRKDVEAGAGGSHEPALQESYLGVPKAQLVATDPTTGLSEEEAAERLALFGRNELAERRTHPLLKLAREFVAPMPCMIWIAIAVELADKDWADFTVLLVLQILNAVVGWAEDTKAGNAIAALKAALRPEAHVKRGGRVYTLPAAELVPGDVVVLSAGANVPADCRLLPGRSVSVDQAALTGESLPVTMYEGDVAKMGSSLTRGEVEAVVDATGSETFFGKTAALIGSVHELGHFQKILLKITFFLIACSLVMVSTCLGYLLYHGEDVLEAIAFSVVLLIASIPIAMQVVCTTTMALGARTLAEEKAIVARLSSIEELAGMSILCSDKTGTMTQNKMELQRDIALYLEGVTPQEVLLHAGLAARWKEPAKDALDRLVLSAADVDELDHYQQLDYMPFDPSVKRTEATLRDPRGRMFKVSKGAPQVLLDLCTGNRDEIREKLETKVQGLAMKGTRCLAVARTDDHGVWYLMGLLTFLDPPRPDTRETIEVAHSFGIDVKMITGDQKAIAVETCRVLGMGQNVLGADSLPGDMPTGETSKTLGADYGQLIESADGFAQVFPQHKFMIVEALRQRGYVVGMTGDGVNDAPALKRADVGVAVEGATDAAQAAGDIVLTQPGLKTIIRAIIIAREVFQRMKNYVIYRIACTIQLLTFFFIGVLAFHPESFNIGWPAYFKIPVIGLVLITILNDGTIISIAYDRVSASKHPETWALAEVYIVSSTLGLIAVASSLLLLFLTLQSSDPHGFWQAHMGMPELRYEQIMCTLYLKVSLSDFLTVFSARTRGFFFSRRPGALLVAAFVCATTASTLFAHFWPFGEMEGIPGSVCGAVWIYCIMWWFVQDLGKVFLYTFLYHVGFATETKELDDRQRKRQMQRRARSMRGFVTKASYIDRPPPPSVRLTADEALQKIASLEDQLERIKESMRGQGTAA